MFCGQLMLLFFLLIMRQNTPSLTVHPVNISMSHTGNGYFLHITMKRNLLNCCNLVSISKKFLGVWSDKNLLIYS